MDMAHSPAYGGSDTFLIRSDGAGRPASPEERQAGRRLEARARRLGADGGVVALLRLVHGEHLRNGASPPALTALSESDVLVNLAARNTACGDVALALSILLNRAGYRTRVLLLATGPERLGRADHVTMEVFSPELRRWVLLEGLLGQGIVPGGISRTPAGGLLDLLADPSAMEALNAAHGQRYYTDKTCFATILPDPDYTHPLEVLWAPTVESARQFLAQRFGMAPGE
ncbi:hypothetical protein [Magnetospirillum sp. ME-1]|uniref:hypothetical protein n=1 Tax=Magnetospirillum sp. ME-1 TaxID=1639348 RepID=UPI0011AE665D|nr:hypothetical protein [Magnetospirillum sp. ME-1]